MIEWMVYGAHEKIGKKLVSTALQKGYRPIIAGNQGQALVDLAFHLTLPVKIFSLSEDFSRQIQGCRILINCSRSDPDEYARLAHVCSQVQCHYLDMSNNLSGFDGVMALGRKFEQAKLVAVAGLHPDVIGCELVAGLLKRQLPDATSIILACSQTVGFFQWYADNYFEKGRVLTNGQLQHTQMGQTMLVPFGENNEKPTLVVSDPHAALLAVWHSSRIPHIKVYRKAGHLEVRLLQLCELLRWVLNIPYLKGFLKKQWRLLEKYRDRSVMKPSDYRFWGTAQNSFGKTMTMVLTLPAEKMNLQSVFALLNLLMAETPNKSGFFSATKILGLEFFVDPKSVEVKKNSENIQTRE